MTGAGAVAMDVVGNCARAAGAGASTGVAWVWTTEGETGRVVVRV